MTSGACGVRVRRQGGNVASRNVSSECGVTAECGSQGGMWCHGMCRPNAASPGNVASGGNAASENVSSQCGVAGEVASGGSAASGHAASECGRVWRRNVSSASGPKCYTMCGHPEYIAAAVTYYTHFRQRGFNTLCEYVCRGCFAVLVGKDIEAQHCTALLTSGADKMSRESFEASKSG